jgi:NB-ARC domain
MNAASLRNDFPVSMTPALRRKLLETFRGKFNSIEDFLNTWRQQTTTLGEPPSETEIQTIFYSVSQGTCAYWMINGVCQLLLSHPYRDHSTKQVPTALKQELRQKFHEHFKLKGEIAWGEFAIAWAKRLDDAEPPRHQTIRNFLESEQRNSCEHWLVDGLCYLLLDASFDTLICKDKQVTNSLNSQQTLVQKISSKVQIEIENTSENSKTVWIGREQLIAKLSDYLQQDCRVLALVGITGIGKTALATRLTLEPKIKELFSDFYTITISKKTSNFEVVARQLLGTNINKQLYTDDDYLMKAVVAKFCSNPCLLILDMVEEIIESNDQEEYQFIEPEFTDFLEQVVKTEQCEGRVILTSQDQPPIIVEGRYPERVHIERLKGLEKLEALKLFKYLGICWETEKDSNKLERIVNVYEGHPLALRVIAGEIIQPPYNGDIEAYWHEYGYEIEEVERIKYLFEEQSRLDLPRIDRYSIGLNDLVKKRVERTFLRLYKSDSLACLMICSGAVYRRAVERQAWLLMLNEYAYESQVLAFQTLQRRFLLEEESREHKILYRLHNLIRRVALDYLPKIEQEVVPLTFQIEAKANKISQE